MVKEGKIEQQKPEEQKKCPISTKKTLRNKNL